MSDKPSYNVILKGFDTLDQANSWIDWYSGQGEQDDCMCEWIGGGVAVYTSGNTTITGNSIEQGVVVHYMNNNDR